MDLTSYPSGLELRASASFTESVVTSQRKVRSTGAQRHEQLQQQPAVTWQPRCGAGVKGKEAAADRRHFNSIE